MVKHTVSSRKSPCSCFCCVFCTVLHCTVLYCTTLQSNTLVFSTSTLHYITHNTVFHRIPSTRTESFGEETSMVQLQLLTATVKLFLKQPETSQVRIKMVYSVPHFVAI